MRIAWSAIVKNEAAILERCVQSLLPHIDAAVVLDTGSTDGTPELLERLFDQAGKPLELHHSQFLDFAHARNLALAAARASPLAFDYLLLSDADMDLVVEDPAWTKKLNGGPAYDVKQMAGSLAYWNRRLLSRSASGNYQCPTHEYLDVPTAGALDGIHFVDHADGSSRPGKFERDIALLEAALKTETRPGLIERIHFYLGQSYFDSGDWAKAAAHYKIRAGLGGFEEERWNAQLHYAHCLDNMGNHPGFVWEMCRAYSMRPSRAEALYDLAKFFRERSDNFTSLLFAEAGLQVPKPNDLLFVNDWVYDKGLREEFAICAYYDERKRSRGAKECNQLALAGSEQARSNMFWYLQPLSEHVPSFKPQQINFKPPDGYVACNPSITNYKGNLWAVIRTVNYTINAEGGYDIRDGDGYCSNSSPIRTRNFLVGVAPYSLSIGEAHELALPENWPEPKYHLVRGLEDSRLFEWQGELWTLSTVRELNPEGYCEQVLAPLVPGGYGAEWKRILPKERRHEKNWSSFVYKDDLRFIYRLGTLVDLDGRVVFQDTPGLIVDNISGGSQVVQVDERTWLALVHEARSIPGRTNRFYQHRFVTFWPDGRVDRISAPFFFHDKQIEFAAGLAVFDKKLMVSYGVRDCEAWLATIDVDEVLRFVCKDTP